MMLTTQRVLELAWTQCWQVALPATEMVPVDRQAGFKRPAGGAE
jgi:hypothetical protein